MFRNCCLILAFHLAGVAVFAQTTPKDSSWANKDTLPPVLEDFVIDTSLDYDIMFDELAAFLDSISSPRSYTMAAFTFGKGYFNYKRKNDIALETTTKITFTPTAGYYHKNGLGVSAMASFVNDQKAFTFYQLALSPSYDYLANRNLATGFSYTRYFTKDSLSFYTSPLQNELYAYFTVRKWWFKPMVALSYGWGSRSEYEEREEYITSFQLRRAGFTRINTTESINDFSLITSVRHDFYWLDVLNYKDHIRITPQLSFTSGSQKFGFNQSSNTYAIAPRSSSNILYSSENVYLDSKLYFQPLSLTFYLRTEYAIGKFYIQPQLIFDYYFPATENRFSNLFALNAGVMF